MISQVGNCGLGAAGVGGRVAVLAVHDVQR